MKKIAYEKPMTEIVEMSTEDVIRTSGAGGPSGGKPGNGWGDGGHTGPPGQNKKNW